MHPTLLQGDRLLVLRCYSYRLLHNGQIVVGQIPSQEIQFSRRKVRPHMFFVKRLIGMPGDKVTISLTESDALSRYSSEAHDNVTWQIDKGYCFVKGDSSISEDSVTWGPIRLNSIAGIVLLKMPHNTIN